MVTPPPVQSFTIEFPGITNVIVTDVTIGEAFDISKIPVPPRVKTYKAIWDTGATGSCISPRVVAEFGLIPITKRDVYIATSGPDSKEEKNVYLVSIGLPNRVGIPSLTVTDVNLHDADVLIGMDIVGAGDFAISNFQGKTVCTFRMPSTEKISFVPIASEHRNALCPCGSGKKYKKCHGAGK
jgi:hypothetical protein